MSVLSDAQIKILVANQPHLLRDYIPPSANSESSISAQLIEEKAFWDRVIALGLDASTTAIATTKSAAAATNLSNKGNHVK